MNRLLRWPTLLLVTGGLLAVLMGGRPSALAPSIEDHRSILISRIAEVAELTTLKVPVSQVMTSELAGYVGGISCIVVVNGEVALGVDLEKARIEDIDPDNRTATLILPPPEVHYARLDHERTKVYSIDRHGLWWLALGDEAPQKLVNKAMREAQSVIEVAVQEPQLTSKARDQADRVLNDAVGTAGWSLRIMWRDNIR